MGNMHREGPPEDYPYIRAWGRLMGSYGPHVEQQVARARAAGLPRTVLHEKYSQGPTGIWVTIEQITDADTRNQLWRWAQNYATAPVPRPGRPRCEGTIQHGLVSGVCDALLDNEGRCPKHREHVDGQVMV